MKRNIMIKRAKKLKPSAFVLIATEVFHGRMMHVDSRDGNSYYVSPVPRYCEIGRLFHSPDARIERNIHILSLALYHLWKYGSGWI